jgi:hypothetical protein
VTATGETLTGAALIDHRRQTHSAAGKKWAADAEAVLKDLQVNMEYCTPYTDRLYTSFVDAVM